MPQFQTIDTGGTNIRVAVEGEGPLVLMVHGFPESWYSWRHQMGPVAEAGFTAAAIDVRGYGGSDRPKDIAAYSMEAITADVAAVAKALQPEGQAILVGTPSGVTLAPEGGAHQSITTPSLGIEQPGCTTWEPAFVLDTEWILLSALSSLGKPDGGSAYLRLSTRPVDQSLAQVPADPAARERRRRQVLAGAYALRRTEAPQVTIAAMGAMVTEALAAADRLAQQGIAADVVCVTSPGLLFRAIQASADLGAAGTWILDQAFPAARATPLVTVLDGHPHTLAFLANIRRVPLRALGVTRFGQSGSLAEVYRYHGIDTDSIVRAALDLTDR